MTWPPNKNIAKWVKGKTKMCITLIVGSICTFFVTWTRIEVYFWERNLLCNCFFLWFRGINYRRPFRQNIYRRFSFSTPNGQETFFFLVFIFSGLYNQNTRLNRQIRIKSFTHYYYYIIQTRQKWKFTFVSTHSHSFIVRKLFACKFYCRVSPKIVSFGTILCFWEKPWKIQFRTVFIGVWEITSFNIPI